MSKKKTTKKAPKATAKATVQVKKDAAGRFWLVPKVGGAEQGPFATKKEALDAKAGTPVETTKAAKAKKAKEPKARKVGALDAAAQVLAASKEPMNTKAMAATAGVYALRSRAAQNASQPARRSGEAPISLKLLGK